VRTRDVSIKRRAPLRRKTPLRKKRLQPRPGPERDPIYLAWIRTLACVVCCQTPSAWNTIEAAHTNALGPRGMSQKASDYSAIPLCSWHHRHNRDSYHALGEKRFAREHQINLQELVLALNNQFLRGGHSNRVRSVRPPFRKLRGANCSRGGR